MAKGWQAGWATRAAAAALTAAMALAGGAEPLPELDHDTLAASAGAPSITTQGRGQVHLTHAGARRALETALDTASSRLADSACQSVVAEFKDRSGRALSSTLATGPVSVPAFLAGLHYFEGAGYRACKSGEVLAFTQPGSRVVFVCSPTFGKVDSREAWATILHEMLHAMGLDHEAGGHITRTVLQRCDRR